jgi:hypothetical protein
MNIRQTSSPPSVLNPIGTPGLSTNGISYTELKSVDYNQIYIEQPQFQSHNKHPTQAHVHSGQLVSMSGFINNGQFIPIQLNAMTSSISNNSIQEINGNQPHIPSTVAYQCSSSPLYQQSTNVQASPPLLDSNIPPPHLDRMKRGHHDVSSSIDNDVSLQEEGWQTARGSKKINRTTYNSNNTNAANQYTTESTDARPETYRNRTPDAEPQNSISNGNNHVTIQAQRYAMTRYPFSPFVIHFKDDVRDKLVIEHLMKHAKEQLDFVLQIIGYRKSQVNCIRGEYDVLVFVETTDSFEFLFNDVHWPSQLVGKDYTLKKPSIPPQLSAVIQNVALNIDWEDFTADLQSNYPDIVKVVRLKNRKLQDLKSVKIEIKSVKVRTEILEHQFIGISNIRYKVVEYLALANVLICSRCMGIGHFQKNCPQHDQVTCKTCGEKCSDIKDHSCSGVPKCIHCGEAHRSNDSKCLIVKDYRAALTRALLNKPPVPLMENLSYQNFPSHTSREPPFTHSSAQITVDMDQILKKMEVEGEKTRSFMESFKSEMLELNSENKRRIDLLDEKLEINEREVRDMQATIKSLEEKLEVREQKVQYIQNKSESTESKFFKYELDMNVLLTSILRVFVVLRDNKILPMPDDFYSLFIDKIKMLDGTASSPSKQANVSSPKRK